MGAVQVIGGERQHIRLNVFTFGDYFATQFRRTERGEHVFVFVTGLVQGLSHGGDSFIVGIGVDDDLFFSLTGGHESHGGTSEDTGGEDGT